MVERKGRFVNETVRAQKEKMKAACSRMGACSGDITKPGHGLKIVIVAVDKSNINFGVL